MECSWSYQHPPRVGRDKQHKVEAAPPAVREIAWKAQCRLYKRYRALIRNGKLKTIAITAVAREFAGFIWAVSREIAWKAQHRLYARYRALIRKGKLKTVAVTAVARELCGFIWAVNRTIAGAGATAAGIR